MQGDFRLSKDSFSNWHETLVSVLDDIDGDNVPELLCDGLRGLLDFDFGALFALREHSAPIRLFDEIPTEPVDYVTSPYLLDPVYISFRGKTLPRVATMRDISPPGFQDSEYFNTYMKKAEIRDELSFNVPVDDATTLHFVIARRGERSLFRRADKLLAESVAAIVSALLTRHWQSRATRIADIEEEAKDFHVHLNNVMESFGKDVLTGREQEIVQLTLRGYSDKTTARELEITPGTVRNHKKSIFSKLRVSSQGQLFGLFLGALETSEGLGPDEDPIAGVLTARGA